jgi:hypothetical protein
MSNPDYSMTEEISVREFLAKRKLEGLRIDPATAEVTWSYRQILDPYGIYDDLSVEEYQVGRVYFARAPDGDCWVAFRDLPDYTRQKLWEAHERKLALPAGIQDVF